MQTAVSQPSDEAEARKARSIAQFEAEGVLTIAHLPTIEEESESQHRDKEEVVRRAIALVIVAVKGETNDHERQQALINQFNASGFLNSKGTSF